MSALSDFAENKLIDFLFRAQALGITGATAAAGTGPANLYIALFTTAPTDSTAGTEVVAGAATAYARVTVASSLANWSGTQGAGTIVASTGTGGLTSNNAAITFPTPNTTAWGSVVAVGIMDASTAGNLLALASLTAAKTINVGDPAPSFAAGALTFALA